MTNEERKTILNIYEDLLSQLVDLSFASMSYRMDSKETGDSYDKLASQLLTDVVDIKFDIMKRISGLLDIIDNK